MTRKAHLALVVRNLLAAAAMYRRTGHLRRARRCSAYAGLLRAHRIDLNQVPDYP
jgi:hypothetical protein